jgi:hypothetical protein
MNLGCSSVSLLLIAMVAGIGWVVARLAGWSPLATIAALLALVLLLGGWQVWRAVARQRQLTREGRWPPDRRPGAA